MNTAIGSLDWALIVLYLLAVVGLGVAAGFLRRPGERGGLGEHPRHPPAPVGDYRVVSALIAGVFVVLYCVFH